MLWDLVPRLDVVDLMQFVVDFGFERWDEECGVSESADEVLVIVWLARPECLVGQPELDLCSGLVPLFLFLRPLVWDFLEFGEVLEWGEGFEGGFGDVLPFPCGFAGLLV